METRARTGSLGNGYLRLFVTPQLPGCLSKRESSAQRPAPVRCRRVFALVPSQVLSALLMVNYLTMNHTAPQGGGQTVT